MGVVKGLKNIFLFSGLLIFVIGCASGHCRGRKVTGETSAARVLVFKTDGSRQCAKNSGIKPADMAKTMDGIQVLSSESRHDGKMRIQACGTSTGQINVYEISESDLEKAKALGFELLSPVEKK